MKNINQKLLFGSFLIAVLCLVYPMKIYAEKTSKTNVNQTQVSGLIVDENGEPLLGVSVQVKGTTNGTITDIDGRFTLNCSRNEILIISYVGYTTLEIKANTNLSHIVLKEDNELLDEVVVVGYGTMKKLV